ncbi:hypothetical protein Pmani_027017 [Petrolisthes manimaculis]|uniref:Uncharacterized protein n=1 Tax=Petrolisthes manimaculis TaxID=1843537 RepID=A0AAE1TZI8_9EUCA|nr:hypothetical protein Pmani_027017 [Petrolisthes manimaculis]
MEQQSKEQCMYSTEVKEAEGKQSKPWEAGSGRKRAATEEGLHGRLERAGKSCRRGQGKRERVAEEDMGGGEGRERAAEDVGGGKSSRRRRERREE